VPHAVLSSPDSTLLSWVHSGSLAKQTDCGPLLKRKSGTNFGGRRGRDFAFPEEHPMKYLFHPLNLFFLYLSPYFLFNIFLCLVPLFIFS
jgi:hypothetical protein